MKFDKVMAIPILLYGSETWTLTSNQLRRIEVAEMKLLRPLAGYTHYDHKRNADIRTKLNMNPILDAIKNYRNNWHAHVLRMPYNRLPKGYFTIDRWKARHRMANKAMERQAFSLKRNRPEGLILVCY